MTTARPRHAEYADSAHLEVPEPPARRLGFSAWDYGDQRFGDAKERHDGFAEPGPEGEVALALLIEDGGIVSHTCYDNVQLADPDGSEKMPGDGFERGIRIHVKNERSR